ncbi:MAG: Dabb family protein [Planctomycetota bacterium]
MSAAPFHHVILIRLRQGVSLAEVRDARAELQALVETLPGVLHLTVSENLAEKNAGYTLALFSVFEDRAAFEIFRRHPEWIRVERDFLAPIQDASIHAEGG